MDRADDTTNAFRIHPTGRLFGLHPALPSLGCAPVLPRNSTDGPSGGKHTRDARLDSGKGVLDAPREVCSRD